MSYLARINPRYFAAIHQCAAKNDVRYYLNAIYIERHPDGGVVIVGTNGHVLAAMHDDTGWMHPSHDNLLVGTTTKRMLSALVKPRGQDGLPPAHLWIGANCLVLSSCEEVDLAPGPFDPQSHLAERSELVDGKFPDWRKILPPDTGSDESEPWVNSAYLALFNDVAKALQPGAYLGGGIHLARSGEHASIIVRVLHEGIRDKFFGLLMPMRGENLKSKVPAFARQTKQEGLA
ncbi:TPA: hypothetical protein SL272_000873 [Pseudomonas aeruginosa]|nr:hypothetical protein [Pseudomonas aeruginosa]